MEALQRDLIQKRVLGFREREREGFFKVRKINDFSSRLSICEVVPDPSTLLLHAGDGGDSQTMTMVRPKPEVTPGSNYSRWRATSDIAGFVSDETFSKMVMRGEGEAPCWVSECI